MVSDSVSNETEMKAADAAPDEVTPDQAAAWEAERAELQERILRTQAEFQNLRRRSEKERLEHSEYASMEAVRLLLPILDDFDRALQSDASSPDYAKGMELIQQRFYSALQRLGLEPIPAQGLPFDPHMHHAVEMVETDEAPDQEVLAEFQRGYNFKGRMLRAAMVKVAVGPK
jgi:molecular chaperone GrpE